MPPPPPPGPLPTSILAKAPTPANNSGRAALLSDIQSGIKLKKTETNDRSAPILGGKVSATNSSTSNANVSPSKSSAPPAGGLGGLFANGVPKKPSEARNLQKTGLIGLF
jgi:hypothetical protein